MKNVAALVLLAIVLPSCATRQASDETATAAPMPSLSAHHRHRRHHRHDYAGGENDTAAGAASANAQPSGAPGYPCDDAKFAAIQTQFASGALEGDREVDVCGNVTRVLAARTTRSGLHGYFYLQVKPGDEIEIVSDLGEMSAPAWPWVATGDSATVRGRYYFDSASSQGIDWTHRGASRSWPDPGYVVINGRQYR